MKHSGTSRRRLLAAGAAAVGTAAWGGRDAVAAGRQGVRFGVRVPFPTRDLRERALLLQKLGFDGIELGPEYLDPGADEIKKALAGTGLAVSAIVGSLRLLDPDPVTRRNAIEIDRQRLVLARALGAVGVIEVPTFGKSRYPEIVAEVDLKRMEDDLLVEQLKLLAPDVKKTGVKILIEPLTRKETHFMNLQAHGARIIDAVKAPGFTLLSDFYHMQMEETDIARTLTEVGKHTAYVHLADGEKRTEPGSLPFDYRPAFKSLKRHGFAGWLTIESGASDNPEAALGRAFRYIKQQWSEA